MRAAGSVVLPLLMLPLGGCSALAGERAPTPDERAVPDASTARIQARAAAGLRSPLRLPRDELRDSLRALTPAEARDFLALPCSLAEREHVGFYGISLAECIERVVDASGDGASDGRLAQSVDLYLDMMRYLQVRRGAGAAACMPVVR